MSLATENCYESYFEPKTPRERDIVDAAIARVVDTLRHRADEIRLRGGKCTSAEDKAFALEWAASDLEESLPKVTR